MTAFTCSFPSHLGFTYELLGKEPAAFMSIDYPFGPFAPLNSSTALLDCSIGWPGVAYSPLSHS